MQILVEMKTDQHGQMVFSENDLVELIMCGLDPTNLNGMIVDASVDLETAALMLDNVPKLIAYNDLANDTDTKEFDHSCQSRWFMPDQYLSLDIAEHVLGMCQSNAELQRCGQELLLFQERNLFDLLRYLVYLVDTMRDNQLIWGVGRGSSVASYVLYKLGVHRIDSLHYDLDPEEFLR
jgi:hypothetical protein